MTNEQLTQIKSRLKHKSSKLFRQDIAQLLDEVERLKEIQIESLGAVLDAMSLWPEELLDRVKPKISEVLK